MTNLNTLPPELRLCIYDQILPTGTLASLKPLGFRHPHIEFPPPNVTVTLPTSALMELYKSNPAGESKGRFWRPEPLLSVSRQFRREVGHRWGKLPITVETWMSFLSNRPGELLSRIQHVHFYYRLRWSPQIPPTHPRYALDGLVNSIVGAWGEQLERLYAMMGSEMQKISIDMTLIWPPVLTFRVKQGFSKDSLMLLRANMPVTLETTLTGFREDGKWPEVALVVDNIAEPPASGVAET